MQSSKTMVTYNFTRSNGTRLQFFYDINIQLWTIYPIDEDDNQLEEADHYNNREQLVKCEGVDFKTRRPKNT
jgi:hypothetical protein